MWGSIIGFGKLHYTYKTGRQGDMPQFGIANRKQAITLYMSYHIEQYEALNRLGKYRTGKGCLYIKKLEDVDLNVLYELIVKAIKYFYLIKPIEIPVEVENEFSQNNTSE